VRKFLSPTIPVAALALILSKNRAFAAGSALIAVMSHSTVVTPGIFTIQERIATKS
jgi:hypothetical protein